MQLVLQTADLPPERRFDYWRETACRHFYVFSPVGRLPEGPYDARLLARQVGPFGLVSFEQPSYGWLRSRREIQQSDDGTYVLVGSLPRAATLVRMDGRDDLALYPGSLSLCASDTRLEVRQVGRGAHLLLKFPREMLDALLPLRLRGRPPSCLIPGTPGAGAMLAGYFQLVMREMPRLDAAAAEAALRHLVGLLALHQCSAAGPASAEGREAGRAALRAARLAEAHALVECNLADPALDAARVAAALRISVRQLSLLFEPSGESFARHVTRRRLEEARRLLASPGAAERKVADIAFACGFDSLATFYRAFRRTYGMAPGELREAPRQQGAA